MTTPIEFKEKYGITDWHSGGGCYHGGYALQETDDIYWLINHCDENGDPDLEMITDDSHKRTMFGLMFNYSDAKEIAASIFQAFTKNISGCDEPWNEIDDSYAQFVTDFQTGYKLMVAISNAIDSELISIKEDTTT